MKCAGKRTAKISRKTHQLCFYLYWHSLGDPMAPVIALISPTCDEHVPLSNAAGTMEARLMFFVGLLPS